MNTLTRKVNRKGTILFIDDSETIVKKQCTNCKEIKHRDEYQKDRGRKDGLMSICSECSNKRSADFKEKNPDYRRQWEKDNPNYIVAAIHNYRARKVGIDAGLTAEIVKGIREEQQGRCILSGLVEDLEFEHAVPVNKGGGSTFENCYFVNQYLNRSMKNANMFEWAKRQYKFIQRRFYNTLVPMLAERNNMTPEEYKIYVYSHYENNNQKEI